MVCSIFKAQAGYCSMSDKMLKKNLTSKCTANLVLQLFISFYCFKFPSSFLFFFFSNTLFCDIKVFSLNMANSTKMQFHLSSNINPLVKS